MRGGNTARPNPSFSRTGPSFRRPNSSFRRPNSSFQRPNSSFRRPNSSFQRPNSSFRRPNSSFRRPNSSFRRPNSSFRRPNSSFRRKPESRSPGPQASSHIRSILCIHAKLPVARRLGVRKRPGPFQSRGCHCERSVAISCRAQAVPTKRPSELTRLPRPKRLAMTLERHWQAPISC